MYLYIFIQREKGREKDIQIDRQIDRQVDRQVDRQMIDRQIDRQTGRQINRQIDADRFSFCLQNVMQDTCKKIATNNTDFFSLPSRVCLFRIKALFSPSFISTGMYPLNCRLLLTFLLTLQLFCCICMIQLIFQSSRFQPSRDNCLSFLIFSKRYNRFSRKKLSKFVIHKQNI